MKILLLGATGRVGNVLLEKMLEDGHQLVALVRSPEKITIKSPDLHIIEGNVLDEKALEEAITKLPIEAVMSALNTDKNDTLSKYSPVLIRLMGQYGIKRVITIGTAGILNSRGNPAIYRFESDESKRKLTTAVKDHLALYQNFKESNLDWTIVCPTFLPDGEETGEYRVEADMLPADGRKISVQDTGAFAYAQLENEAFIGKRVGITY